MIEKEIVLNISEHKGQERLFASFNYHPPLNAIIKNITGARWSQSKKQWHFPANKEVINQITLSTKGIASVHFHSKSLMQVSDQQTKPSTISELPQKQENAVEFVLNNVNKKELVRFLEYLKLKTYSPST
ncbi:MAG: hypothetical protein ABR502_11615, partial [Chitinophagaceae bacterium]